MEIFDKMDLISVIVPVYNVESYLHRCVDSILRQTYKEFEIILVDDGSTDNSGKICDEYKSVDNRVKVIHQSNKGQSVARNKGIDEARGKWICFVDSDDFIQDDYLEYLLGLCIKYRTKISQCGCVKGKDFVFPDEVADITEKKWQLEDLYCSPKRLFRGIVCTKLFSRDLFQDYRFPAGKIFEDEDAAFILSYKAGEIAVSNRHCYYYYQSPGSVMRKERPNIRLDFVELFEKRIKLLEKNSEKLMVEVTKKELCLRLMLNYCIGWSDFYKREKECPKIYGIYRKYYNGLKMKKVMPKKEITALYIFSLCPNLFAFLENRFKIIAFQKERRTKQ